MTAHPTYGGGPGHHILAERKRAEETAKRLEAAEKTLADIDEAIRDLQEEAEILADILRHNPHDIYTEARWEVMSLAVARIKGAR